MNGSTWHFSLISLRKYTKERQSLIDSYKYVQMRYKFFLFLSFLLKNAHWRTEENVNSCKRLLVTRFKAIHSQFACNLHPEMHHLLKNLSLNLWIKIYSEIPCCRCASWRNGRVGSRVWPPGGRLRTAPESISFGAQRRWVVNRGRRSIGPISKTMAGYWSPLPR